MNTHYVASKKRNNHQQAMSVRDNNKMRTGNEKRSENGRAKQMKKDKVRS